MRNKIYNKKYDKNAKSQKCQILCDQLSLSPKKTTEKKQQDKNNNINEIKKWNKQINTNPLFYCVLSFCSLSNVSLLFLSNFHFQFSSLYNLLSISLTLCDNSAK